MHGFATERVIGLPPRVESAGSARRFVTAALRDAGRPELIDIAVVLVSELATNVVLHANTAFVVVTVVNVTGCRVEVRDERESRPAVRHHDEMSTTGRGLRLVDAFADDWGVDVTPEGKCVWFFLAGADPEAATPPLAVGI
jgi:anti-sigma regulatory factor (Ser/Thr protein kinase)